MKLNISKILPALLITLTMPVLGEEYSPALNQKGASNLYWGDLHVHSNLSPDAFSFGNHKLTPDDALNFAKGKTVVANNGMKARLQQPLDFLLVADHAEFIGVFPKLLNDDPGFLATDLGAKWKQLKDKKGGVGPIIFQWLSRIQNPDYVQELPESYRRQVWGEVATIADRHNDPGQFTAFVGYEWTAMIKGNNLHRVVLYRDGAKTATKIAPFSALDSKDPEKLWAALANYEEKTGGDVMAIPHNGNVSNGLMFSDKTVDGKPFDKAYAEMRNRWEPLYEVTQVKGDGEAHPFLSPDDEFADYETWDEDNIGRTVAKQNSMLKHEYGRSALKLGLEFDKKLGANPYKFGMIGSTDDHTSLATADDNNFWGKFLDSEPSAKRTHASMGGMLWKNWKLAASGYTGVWARENTREALFDAMERKEVYATTGPRIALRFFGGWEFSPEDAVSSDLVNIGYSKGVPMGAEMPTAPNPAVAPTFLLHTLKDPHGANLDRMQVVKGWLNAKGVAEEKVYDVALSDGRRIDPATGKAPSIESTVNVEEASYSNSVGEVSWSLVWQDPDFDPAQLAFYYVRVIEIPTPRWTAYDAKYFDKPSDPEIPMVTQERIYSSPIWYTP
jgi:Protein of unknown function (DUF3604)